MRARFHLTILLLLGIMFVSACTPRQLRPVATVDHTPFLKVVIERRTILETGITGTLEMDFKRGDKHFRGKSYIVAYPNGRFRLEIPGPWGSTLLVMTSDGENILAYYPEEAKAYRSLAEGRSLNPYLPFPLPVDPDRVPALMMGVFPEGGEVTDAKATLMDSGTRILWTRWNDTELQFEYDFRNESKAALTLITAHERDMYLTVTTEKTFPHLPRNFTITFPDASLKGEWKSASLFAGTETDLGFLIPDHVTVIDLEEVR